MPPWYIDLLRHDIINSICLSIFVSNWVKKFSLEMFYGIKCCWWNTNFSTNIFSSILFYNCTAIRLYFLCFYFTSISAWITFGFYRTILYYIVTEIISFNCCVRLWNDHVVMINPIHSTMVPTQLRPNKISSFQNKMKLYWKYTFENGSIANQEWLCCNNGSRRVMYHCLGCNRSRRARRVP